MGQPLSTDDLEDFFDSSQMNKREYREFVGRMRIVFAIMAILFMFFIFSVILRP